MDIMLVRASETSQWKWGLTALTVWDFNLHLYLHLYLENNGVFISLSFKPRDGKNLIPGTGAVTQQLRALDALT